MKVISSVEEMQSTVLRFRRDGVRIALVPTMGYLHEGHLSLIRLARQSSDLIVVSIFVNPTQFGPGEDFDSYPRDMERDCRLCEGEGVDIVFCPEARAMYAPDWSVRVDESVLSHGLCGASRPGHFRGVVTVVAKLFNIVQPEIAVFGQKDAQQVRIVEQMVRDLNFPVKIVIAPTIREPDGLAMSSRNSRLSVQERADALCLYMALCLARELFAGGQKNAALIKAAMEELIGRVPSATIQYIATVDRRTLKEVECVDPSTLVALAVKVGNTRLIDNVVISMPNA